MLLTSQNQPAVQRREEGRLQGKGHARLPQPQQMGAIAKGIEGLNSTDPLERAFWQGYAETAWTAADAFAFGRVDGLYAFLPQATEYQNGINPFRFISSYQGETEYHTLPHQNLPPGSRLRFRWARLPWRWSWQKPDQRYWNWEKQEDFEREHNSSHRILMRESAEPVDAQTLELFQKYQYPDAVTGYYDHLRNRFVVCEPTTAHPSKDSYSNKQAGKTIR